MKKLSERLSYANVITTLALFLALADRHRRDQAPEGLGRHQAAEEDSVTGAKVKEHTLTGKNVDLSKLGTVPSTTNAGSASALTPLEPFQRSEPRGSPRSSTGRSPGQPNRASASTRSASTRTTRGSSIWKAWPTSGPGESGGRGPDLPAPPGFRPAPRGLALIPEHRFRNRVSVLGARVKSETGQDVSGAVLAFEGKETVAA